MLSEDSAVMTEVPHVDRGMMVFQEHVTDVICVHPYCTESFLTEATQTSSHHNRRAAREEQRWGWLKIEKNCTDAEQREKALGATLSHFFLENQSYDQLHTTKSKELKLI